MAHQEVVFTDTSFWVALLNPADGFHLRAVRLSGGIYSETQLITSEYVLIELLNHFARWAPRLRKAATDLSDAARSGPAQGLVRQSEELLASALDLYKTRPDKSWSLSDCTSFVIMQQRGIKEALTSNHHFAQAGFTVLLK